MLRNAFLLLSFIVSFLSLTYFVNLRQTLVPQANAQACTAPVTPSGVTVDYPFDNAGAVNLTRASCAWTLQADATSYNVTVTEVETGTIIKNNESQLGTVSKVDFPITQLKTYKCDVVAVASCGTLSAMVSDQLLCDADALIETPTPTTPPVVVVPPKAVTPTIAPPGGILQTIGLLGGVTLVIVMGIMLFVL